MLQLWLYSGTAMGGESESHRQVTSVCPNATSLRSDVALMAA